MFDKQGQNNFETGIFWQEKEDSPAIEIFNFVVANNVSHTITPHPLFFVKKLQNCSYLLINIANIYMTFSPFSIWPTPQPQNS